MAERNIDLIEHEVRSLEEERVRAYNESQWRAGFAVGMIALFYEALGNNGGPDWNNYLVLAGFALIFLAVIFSFITMGVLRREMDFTVFEGLDGFENADEQVELEVLQRKYDAHLKVIKSVKAYAKWSNWSAVFTFFGAGALVAAYFFTV